MKEKTVGIVGGGQLGRMLADAARTLGVRTVVLDPSARGPAGQVADVAVVGNFTEHAPVTELAKQCDVMTFEIESANLPALQELVASGFEVHPNPDTLLIIKDKLTQKQLLQNAGIPVGDFMQIASKEDALRAGEIFGYPYVLKARSGGYDGRGNRTVTSPEVIETTIAALGGGALYAEKMIPFEKELAVVAVRTKDGQKAVYPIVETIHQNHICHMTLVPAPVPADIAMQAHDIAERVLSAFSGAGVFAVEMFLCDGKVLVNEIAPRVHNSGHWTIEGCDTSQFENHIRAVAGLPLGSVQQKHPASVMVNILGDRNAPANPVGVEEAEALGNVSVHIYGKADTKIERKMGHVTVVGDTLSEVQQKAEQARKLIHI